MRTVISIKNNPEDCSQNYAQLRLLKIVKMYFRFYRSVNLNKHCKQLLLLCAIDSFGETISNFDFYTLFKLDFDISAWHV